MLGGPSIISHLPISTKLMSEFDAWNKLHWISHEETVQHLREYTGGTAHS